MDGLDYQKKLAEYDEQIDYLKLQIAQMEHEKSRFVKKVLDATISDRDTGKNTQMPSGIDIIKKG